MKRKTRALFIVICLTFLVVGASYYWFFIRQEDPDTSHLLRINTADYPAVPSGNNWENISGGIYPISNPLKGFLPYPHKSNEFPHGMDFKYIPVDEIVINDGPVYNFSRLEQLLNTAAAEGRQLTFRLYLDYPAEDMAVPQYLIDNGLTMTDYPQYGGGTAPNYNDPDLTTMLTELISTMGSLYDGDPRIGFIELGLLGHWGEWHSVVNWANETTQHLILQAYDQAFNQTHILTRYPNDITKNYSVGFHDDSFAYSTIGQHSFYFMNQINSTGKQNHWQNYPIGGEVRPEIQAKVFYPYQYADVQDINWCIQETHASWLMEFAIFDPENNPWGVLTEEDLERAEVTSQRLGYTFCACYKQINRNDISNHRISGQVAMTNLGVAPFYYNWTVEIGILNDEHQLLTSKPLNVSLTSLLPEDLDIWEFTLEDSLISEGSGNELALRVRNPLSTGKPVMFANQEMNENGWLPLATI